MKRGIEAAAAAALLITACTESDSRAGSGFGTFPDATGDGAGDNGVGDTSTDGPTGDGATDEGGGDGDGDDGTGDTPDVPDGDTGTGTGEDVNECGDGILGSMEVCDGELFGSLSCQSQGWDDGEIICADDCGSYSTEGCFTCGNGIVEGPEGCDGSVGIATCENQGFTEGTIECDVATCQLVTDGCTTCGDAAVEGEEECDDTDLAGSTCESLGFLMGTLACYEECAFDTASCVTDDFNDDFETGSLQSAWSQTGSGFVVDGTSPIAGSYSAHNVDIDDSQSAGMTITLNYPVAGEISFSHKEDTESGWDYLEFYVDNVRQGQWSGATAVQQQTYPVTAGMHTMEWRYTKDTSVSDGTDTVWVDDIVATGGMPMP